MMEAYKETYTHYTTPNKNIQIVVYRKKPRLTLLQRIKKAWNMLTVNERFEMKQKGLGICLLVLALIGVFLIPEAGAALIVVAVMGIERIAL